MKNAIRYTFVTALIGLSVRLQAASTIQFAQPNCSVSDAAGPVTFNIQRQNDINTPVSVDFATADGTAINGVNYTAVAGTLAFDTNSYSVAEDAGVALIGVRRGSNDSNSTVTVDLVTIDATAISGQDYTGTTNTLTFSPG
ncbi:MAG TPA: Calx-beta domain-containing protein, partial [Verrucomicrobiota bacterium]|nr:Calx-beta domain-containing protein [Verrucomicrobiota bacterium]